MSYRISLDEIDGCLIVTDSERTVKVERFATDGIREVYGRTVELLDRENAKLRERIAELEELLPENSRWFSSEVVEAYVVECRALKTLAAEMHADLTRIIAYPQYAVRHKDELCEYDDRMRALGMEVPDE